VSITEKREDFGWLSGKPEISVEGKEFQFGRDAGKLRFSKSVLIVNRV
jgi:hypothetical protein